MKKSLLLVVCSVIGFILGVTPGEIWHNLQSRFGKQKLSLEDDRQYVWQTLQNSTMNHTTAQQRQDILEFIDRYPESWFLSQGYLQLLQMGYPNTQHLPDDLEIQKNIRSPQYQFFLWGWGQYLKQKGSFTQAEKLFQEILKADSYLRPQTLHELADSYLQRQLWQKAWETWEHLITQFPHTPIIEEAQWGKALAAFKMGQSDPENLGQGAWYLALRDPQQALELLQNSEDPSGCYYRIKILAKVEKFSDVISYSKNFYREFPESIYVPEILYILAKTLATKQQNHREAIEYYQILTQNFRGASYVPSAFIALGDCFVTIGEQQQACQAYLEVPNYTENPNLCQISYYSAAWTYIRRQQVQQAIECLEKAIQYQGNFRHQSHWKLAQLYREQQKFQSALGTLEKLLQSKPASPLWEEIMTTIAEIHLQAEQNEQAKKLFQQVLDRSNISKYQEQARIHLQNMEKRND